MQNNPYSAYTEAEYKRLNKEYRLLERVRDEASRWRNHSVVDYCNDQRHLIVLAFRDYANRQSVL